MTWPARSERRTQLPGNWRQLRVQALERDGYRCTWTRGGRRCEERATDVDHIKPGNDHRLSNLQSLCHPHHQRKTVLEAAAARGVEIQERHPGTPHPSTAYGMREDWRKGP
jgi:hypothetical protein